jgi:predicted dithiol-disulfide oxidoreductase (DUF899 family)
VGVRAGGLRALAIFLWRLCLAAVGSAGSKSRQTCHSRALDEKPSLFTATMSLEELQGARS